MPRCKAKSKQTGEQCQKNAVPGYEVCRYHGGATPRGVASANFKHGRYSKYLPKGMLETYQQSLQDANLLSLKEEIALIDSRMGEVLEKAGQGMDGRLWLNFEAAMLDLRTGLAGDIDALKQGVITLDRLIKQGSSAYQQWSELRELIDQRRKLVESQRKYILEQQYSLTMEETLSLVAGIQHAIKAHVQDKQTLIAISEAVAELLYRPAE